MGKVDLLAAPGPNTEARALADYHDVASDPRYKVFAMLVGRGTPSYKAYLTICPDASDATARTQSSVLIAHPEVRRWALQHAIGARKLVEAHVPMAVDRVAELAAQNEDRLVALKAAQDLQDRGGLPKAKELAITAQTTVHALYRHHTGDVRKQVEKQDIIELEPLKEGARVADSAKERESWATLLPPPDGG